MESIPWPIYLIGQFMLAVLVPLLNYWLTRPHLMRTERKADEVAVKVEEVKQQTNGMQAQLQAAAGQAGFLAGQAAEKANPS